jgi:HSP20 family protein
MELVRLYPFNDINNLQRQLLKTFSDITLEDRTFTLKPLVELLDKKDSLILRVLLPGVDKKDIDVNVTSTEVIIKCDFDYVKDTKDCGCYISEFDYGTFNRTVKLPVEIQNELVTADYTNGVLTLTLPKIEDKNKVFKVSLVEQEDIPSLTPT